MDKKEIEQLRSLTRFEDLVAYLRDELDWPIDFEDARDIDRLTFDYEPEELGLDPKHAVKIDTIKQIRPMAETQPWGIFYIEFEAKRLPVTVLRRVLRALVPNARKHNADRKAWDMDDLLFISHQGEPGKRSISFAHFHQKEAGLPELRTFSWDATESHFQYIQNLNLESLRWPEDEADPYSWQKQWDKAFTIEHRYVIRTAQALAGAMAKHAKTIRDLVNEVYALETKDGPLHDLYKSFKTTLIQDLEVDDFADMYAQTVTYGLFTARATQSGEFAIENVAAMIPNTNPFLRELLEELTTQESVDLDELGVGQLVDLLKIINIEAILQDFGRQMQGHDPVIHFYETFLREYDAEKKVERGVFYTPDPVVSFIVRSVDEILKKEFGLGDGLADTSTMDWKNEKVPRVQILDPATGTGTFLKYVIQVVWDTFNQKYMNFSSEKRQEMWNRYVEKNLLPRMYGFELMMAPYSVAHMKLGLFLKELGYKFESDERLRIYLTNTLQPANEIPRTETISLAHEAESANKVKTEKPISVVIGNPPYSVKSYNSGNWIVSILEDYKKTIRNEETQIQAVSNDYVKFLRYAHWIIKQRENGVVGFITNNGYLNGLLFRDMRNLLYNDFTTIYILNLHGSIRWKETGPEGEPDENVFDIQQGVSIIFLVKKSHSNEKERGVKYFDLWGSRESKNKILLSNNIYDIEWEKIFPESPLYMFIPRDTSREEEFNQYYSLLEIFGTGKPNKDKHISYGAGFATQQDEFAISFTKEEVSQKIKILIDESLSEQAVRKQFRLCSTNQWNFDKARQNLSRMEWEDKVIRVAYRPFDFRFTSYVSDVVSIPRWAIMSNLFPEKKNIALIAARIINGEEPRHEFISRLPVEKIFLSSKTSNNAFVFPLYLFDDSPMLYGISNRKVNLSSKFLNSIASKIKLDLLETGLGDLKSTIGPEDVFHYVYGILFSPSYRKSYSEYLAVDFPRVPMPLSLEFFISISSLGADLAALHLLEEDYKGSSWIKNHIPSPFSKYQEMARFIYGKNGTTLGPLNRKKMFVNGKVIINTEFGDQGSFFDGIPNNIWEFHFGGYQVLQKWLYDRRSIGGQPGYTLTNEDITHYKKMAMAIQETVRIMDEIDCVIEDYGGWPI